MSQNFIAVDRDQVLLMPPSLQEWLPADHYAWFVLASVEQMDLTDFVAVYRPDGHGRPAHDPAMMVALLIYAYSRGVCSSRTIERACVEDIAFRVIASNLKPDHATIARFRRRHETALAGLFTEVLELCAEAGLAKVGMITIDGSKLSANALLTAQTATAPSTSPSNSERSGCAASATTSRRTWPNRSPKTSNRTTTPPWATSSEYLPQASQPASCRPSPQQ